MNLSKIQETIDKLTADLRSELGENILSFHIFGSVMVDRDFHPGVSDINTFLIISDTAKPDLIVKISQIYSRYKKLPFAIPLIFKKSELQSALDVFPVEFIEMRDRNRIIFGEDLLKDIEISKENLRRQCEMEIRAKVLGLRKMLFAEKEILKHQDYLFKSLTSTIVLLKQIFRIKDLSIPETRDEIIDGLENIYSRSFGGIKNLYTMRAKTEKITKNIIEKLMEDYIENLEFFIKEFDEIS